MKKPNLTVTTNSKVTFHMVTEKALINAFTQWHKNSQDPKCLKNWMTFGKGEHKEAGINYTRYLLELLSKGEKI